MGAAIGTVAGAEAIEVGRDRFSPVKTTNDLFAIRSDLYRLDQAQVWRRRWSGRRLSTWTRSYKMMGEFDALVKGAPSLRECTRLKVRGPVVFTAEDKLSGEVELTNQGSESRRIGDL